MKKLSIFLAIILALSMLAGCAAGQNSANTANNSANAVPAENAAENSANSAENTVPQTAEKNGDIYILFTSDIHCGIDQGFGMAGLAQIRETLEAAGYTTLLVDDGDATKGEAITELMNALRYDVAIPGNHEFDYGADYFLELAKKADFPYISCNITKNGELVFKPYIIKEAAGKKIAFIGVTTPKTITSSTPSYFQDASGKFVYDFMQDATGEKICSAVQSAADAARAEGADYVYVMGHIGMGTSKDIFTYDTIIAGTSGIDVFLDGHSHDTEQVVMKNKDGKDIVRSACGTKLGSIGYSLISAEKGITETNIWTWNNKLSAPQLLGIKNSASEAVDKAKKNIAEQIEKVVAATDVELTINDATEKDQSGKPIRMIRRAETNLGDLCADAFRVQAGAQIGIVNGGGIRVSIPKGDITYGDIISVFPFGNSLVVAEVSGQQILDALEWAVRMIPGETGGFLHVSGMSFDVDVSVPTSCTADENNMFKSVEGARRVKNAKVGDEPLDPAKTYTLAGTNYTMLEHGDGQTAFDGANILQEGSQLDNQLLIDYIINALGGRIGADYADPYGQGRINIIQ